MKTRFSWLLVLRLIGFGWLIGMYVAYNVGPALHVSASQSLSGYVLISILPGMAWYRALKSAYQREVGDRNQDKVE